MRYAYVLLLLLTRRNRVSFFIITSCHYYHIRLKHRDDARKTYYISTVIKRDSTDD